MLFDRIKDRGAGLCAIFRLDLEQRTDDQGYTFCIHVALDKKEQAYNEVSLVQFIANTSRADWKEEATRALFELRKAITKPTTPKMTPADPAADTV